MTAPALLLVDALLVLLAVPLLAAAGYLLVLALCSRRSRPPPEVEPRLRFDVVVPAHDEEHGIARTVQSLLALDYPAALLRVLVVADNCGDATAARAQEAGALVLVRGDPARPGKGHALAYAFARSLRDGFADAVVIVDADTVASRGLLRAFAARLETGALAVQSNDVVHNPRDSWRTALMAIAFALVNTVRSLGRERLGLSAGLRGNGMCLATALLREVPYGAFSIVEDLEYGIRLAQAGHRVHFAAEVEVASDMVSGERASRSQRLRWEDGRRQMRREHARALVRRGLAVRSPMLLDLAADLLLPPLATLGAVVLAGAAIASGASEWARAPLLSLWAWCAALTALVIYGLRGWVVSGVGVRGVRALAHAPGYLVWKLGLRRARVPRLGWVRTEREVRS